MIRVIVGILALFWAAASPAAAQYFTQVDFGSVIICPADGTMPTFTEQTCEPIKDDNRIDTQHRHIWIQAKLDVPDAMLNSSEPLAVYVRAKAASRIFLNGTLIGENGVPGPNADAETPGLMDTSYFFERDLLTSDGNVLVLELSGHHSILDLIYPFHLLGIGFYADPNAYIMRGYISSLLPFGILIGGALYFGALALRRREDLTSILVPLIAFFAALQLVSEVSRGFVSYTYPFQDVRLMLVLLFASASGLCLILHVVDKFVTDRKTLTTLIGIAITAVAIIVTPGFDGKAIMALQTPALFGALLSWSKARKGKKAGFAYAGILILFALLALPTGFLDTYYYYSVAGLLLFLFAIEIQKNNEERRLHAQEQARADRLQLALDESKEAAAPSQIKIISQGKVELVSTDLISTCKGARDYVELEVEGRGTILHDSSLNQLEQALPPTFLRVHRSYIVNTRFISTLEREASGSGRLLLTNGSTVAVSRRILPKVRKVLM